jgi:hypothetical protein
MHTSCLSEKLSKDATWETYISSRIILQQNLVKFEVKEFAAYFRPDIILWRTLVDIATNLP